MNQIRAGIFFSLLALAALADARLLDGPPEVSCRTAASGTGRQLRQAHCAYRAKG